MKTLQLSIIAIAAILGVGSAIILSLVPSPTTPQSRYNPEDIQIMVDGLRETYKVGEPIEFLVKIEGYGSFCGTPDITVSNVKDPSEILWHDKDQLLFIGKPCNPGEIHVTIRVGEKDNPLVIDRPGTYNVLIPIKGKPLQQEFSVIE